MSKVLVEVSARHVHVTQEALETLYGAGYELHPKKFLSQPGQFVSEEKVTVVGPRSESKLSILGPVRNANQVEISLTDARALGLEAQIKESGDIAGTSGCKIVGPCGEVEITEGVICAKRHIHFNPEQAKEANVENGEVVSVKVETNGRSLTFSDVVCRVSEKFDLAMHIDTDEGNACGYAGELYGEIIK